MTTTNPTIEKLERILAGQTVFMSPEEFELLAKFDMNGVLQMVEIYPWRVAVKLKRK